MPQAELPVKTVRRGSPSAARLTASFASAVDAAKLSDTKKAVITVVASAINLQNKQSPNNHPKPAVL